MRCFLVSIALVSLLRLTETSAEDRTTSVATDDPEMIAAIDNARRTIKQFFDGFMNPKKGQTSFLLKVAFTRGDQVDTSGLPTWTFLARNREASSRTNRRYRGSDSSTPSTSIRPT
jgi:hypothetical protein